MNPFDRGDSRVGNSVHEAGGGRYRRSRRAHPILEARMTDTPASNRGSVVGKLLTWATMRSADSERRSARQSTLSGGQLTTADGLEGDRSIGAGQGPVRPRDGRLKTPVGERPPMSDTDTESETAIPEDPLWERSTAPQSSYSMRQVGIGFLVLLVGAAITFGIPLFLG